MKNTNLSMDNILKTSQTNIDNATKYGKKRRRQEALLGYALASPGILVIVIFSLYPIIQTINLSFHSLKLTMPGLGEPFVGIKNYLEISHSARFWLAVWHTFEFTLYSVVFELVFGLLIALLINRPFFGRGLIRAVVLIPWAIPTAISSMMWKFMFDDQLGVVNPILMKLGIIHHSIVWLGNPNYALGSIIFVDVWKTTPFMALLLLAGLQVIPSELYESAKVDGANAWQRFFKITLPLLKPALLIALLFRTLDAFRVFDVIFILTGGGPGNSTESLSMYAQTVLMRYMDFGHGSALAVVTFVFILLISIFYIRLIGIPVDQENKE
ncbi:sugar ABC transporter permease [Fodinisporobacter ferrooxydans]|uniref:Sugar ABC transporter permease n=1 Tax=Fodinisporobacter ferrooxydans TaxID=2901836 RepID=A0ABY4CDT2_9BACL|nr:sugar ABC transporter permease [Alicyclobacillaceae bacterium MYW30-H2]